MTYQAAAIHRETNVLEGSRFFKYRYKAKQYCEAHNAQETPLNWCQPEGQEGVEYAQGDAHVYVVTAISIED